MTQDLYSQAFTAPAPDVEGLQLAPLYTLQYGLARDAEGACGLEHGHVVLRSFLDEPGAEFLAGHSHTASSCPFAQISLRSGRLVT